MQAFFALSTGYFPEISELLTEFICSRDLQKKEVAPKGTVFEIIVSRQSDLRLLKGPECSQFRPD